MRVRSDKQTRARIFCPMKDSLRAPVYTAIGHYHEPYADCR